MVKVNKYQEYDHHKYDEFTEGKGNNDEYNRDNKKLLPWSVSSQTIYCCCANGSGKFATDARINTEKPIKISG